MIQPVVKTLWAFREHEQRQQHEGRGWQHRQKRAKQAEPEKGPAQGEEN